MPGSYQPRPESPRPLSGSCNHLLDTSFDVGPCRLAYGSGCPHQVYSPPARLRPALHLEGRPYWLF